MAMPDIIRDGAAYLAASLASSAAHVVTLQRGGQSAAVNAVIGKSVFESQTSSGFVESWESRDFIVRKSEYPFGEPVRGDLVTENSNGQQAVYEVCSPAGTPLFHYADAFANSIRLHTKRVN